MNHWPYIRKLLNRLEQTWEVMSYSPDWIIDIEGLVISGDAEEVILLLHEILEQDFVPDLVDLLDEQGIE